ncbi:MAG: aspartate aminotransferase family protein [Sporolactobacillus sp.]|uniref:aspartate aminotransferase family protein n=1 Tax=Sporolactobacillus sp. STSJ-5 TaxID=2965076 RepID=UPI002107C0AA|nr:aspartate aminotransferase family protein [Sporolactobacillus sp. STSJ-5]MCQ2010989.1 aspartate aminotransferase family protein [Sporolactobacillus sp. STSJ-5]
MLNTKSEETIAPVMAAYGRFPITIEKGKGSYVWDSEGTKYLDFTAGIAVLALGHVPDSVEAALKKQLDTLWHCSNLYHIGPQEKLAKMLTDLTCCDQVFFGNSGAEANEGAIKLARRYANLVLHKPEGHIVTFDHSFHGRTLATMAATAQEKIHNGFGSLVPGFKYLPYNDAADIEAIAADEECIAVMLEMVQGEGGVIPADKVWVQKLASVCKEKGIPMIVDEVQSGMGRTGTLFAYEQYGIEPDILTVAKALGSGIPIGAFLAKKHISQLLTPGTHGSTFGGNPFSTAAGVATIEAFEKQNVIAQCVKNADYLNQKLNDLKEKYANQLIDVRGLGLLIGVETTAPAIDIVNQLREKHQVLILTAGKHVLRILPPLVTNETEIDTFIAALDDVLKEK